MIKKWSKSNQHTIIHILLKNFLKNIYVVGQGDQQNDKVGKKSPYPPFTWSRKSIPPPNRLDVEAALSKPNGYI